MNQFLPPTCLRWMFFDLNSYFASVEQQENPALRHRPVAVLPLMSEHTCVIAASYEAKALGIRTGTSVAEARRLCPQIKLVAGRHDLYVDYHHRILEEIDRHIPVTHICSIDEAACALDLSERTAEAATALALRIKQGLRERVGVCIRASIGFAPSRLLAKIATDMMKPNGLVILEPQHLPGRLFDLALTDLPGINRGMSQRLAKGGVTSVEALWNLSPPHAKRLWGSVQGERFWYALHGYDFPDHGTSRSSVSHSQMLASEVRGFNEARLVGRRLVQKAASRLRRLNYYAQQIGLAIRSTNDQKWVGMEPLQGPAQDNFSLLLAYEKLWQQAAQATGRPRLRKVSVWIDHLTPPNQLQPDLFATPRTLQEENRHLQLSQVMDKLNRKYGRDTLLLGASPQQLAHYTGTKIAFNRIPDVEEFTE